MKIELNVEQKRRRIEFARFAKEHVLPHAAAHDNEQKISDELIRKIAMNGYLGSFLPAAWGGRGFDMVSYGLLHEELGKVCSSVRSLPTVHDMVALAIHKWGNDKQQHKWLPRLATGKVLGAFAITEPGIGSDAGGVETVAVRVGDSYVLNGTKKWITFGQIAGMFLVLARLEDKPTAFLVERETAGLSIKPIQGLLGMRGSMSAQLEFRDCIVPAEHLLARSGFGLTSVAFTALGLGRYSIAWGSVAIAQACLDASMQYASQRSQFKVLLKDHQLIQRMISDMISGVQAARLLCLQAGYLKDINDPAEITQTFVAKYFASSLAMKAAADAVQIHGANGCSNDYPVSRYFRDAKIMEIIEGSSQIQQIMISKFGFQEFHQRVHQQEEEDVASAVAVPV